VVRLWAKTPSRDCTKNAAHKHTSGQRAGE
jgi:hypothetical protein